MLDEAVVVCIILGTLRRQFGIAAELANEVDVKTVRFGRSGGFELPVVELPIVELLGADKCDIEVCGKNLLLELSVTGGLYSLFVLELDGSTGMGIAVILEQSRLFLLTEFKASASGKEDAGYNVLDVTEFRW